MYSYNDSEARREHDLLQALFASVAAGNIEAAQADLRMIASGTSGRIAELAAQAGYDLARPYRAPDLATPFVLPIPGHTPGMTLSGHHFAPSAKR